MKRLLAIVLVGVLLCAVGAWLVERRAGPEPSSSGSVAVERFDSKLTENPAPRAEVTPRSSEPAVRAQLAELETLELAFEGPQATLEVHVVDALHKLPVPEVVLALSASRRVSVEVDDLEWEELTPRGNPPGADEAGRIAWSVPAGRALGVEIAGTWVQTERKRYEIAALAPGERRTEIIAVATEDDLHFFGQVFEAGTQTPVAEVEIQLERRPSIEPVAVSDARGRFELRTNSWESRKASAAKRGFAPVTFAIDEQHESESLAQRLDLTHAATIQGYYRDCDDKPLADGSLRFWTRSGFAAHVYPREDGWFEADSLPTGEAVQVDLELEHRPFAREVASIVLGPGELRRSDWKLAPRFPVHGVVLDERGAPVEGCELALYFGSATELHCLGVNATLDERDLCTSDAQGRFAFTKASRGSWIVAALHMGGSVAFLRSPYSWHIALAAENIAVPGVDDQDIVLHCWRYLTLEGRIVDPEDHPVPRAELSVGLVGCEASVQRWTGADGRFSVSLPGPGSYEIGVKGSDWFLEPEKVTARAGERDILIRLKSAPALHVSVIDERNRNPLQAEVFGIGISGASVHILAYGSPDRPGQLAAPCPADSYRLFVRTFDNRCGTLEGVIVDAESPTREWTVTVAPGMHAVVHSSNAGGALEIEFSWNGIPIDAEDLVQGSKIVLSVPPGTLSAKYRRLEPPGDWLTLDTAVDDARLVDIDLPFP